MPRIPVLAFVVLASLLLLETPAQGQSAEEIEELITKLGHPDEGVRVPAAEALVLSGPGAVPALAAALSDDDYDIRRCAAHTLGLIGRKAAPAVPDLILALSDTDKGENSWAKARSTPTDAEGSEWTWLPGVVCVRPPDGPAVLPHRSWDVRWSAARAL